MANFGTPIEEPKQFGTPIEEPKVFGTPIDEPATRGRIKDRYGLSDEENTLIEGAFKEGYEEKKDKETDNGERFYQNARQSFFSNTSAGMVAKMKETGIGTENEIQLAQKRIDEFDQELFRRENGGFSNYPELTDDQIRERQAADKVRIAEKTPQRRKELIDGLAKQARRAGEYAGMPDYDGFVEGSVALVGQLAGSSATPETFVPGGKGATVLKTLGKQALTGALVNTATNPLIQAGNIASGDQEEFSKNQLALDATMGAVVPAALKSPKAISKFLKGRGHSDLQRKVFEEAVELRSLDGEPGVIARAGRNILEKKREIETANYDPNDFEVGSYKDLNHDLEIAQARLEATLKRRKENPKALTANGATSRTVQKQQAEVDNIKRQIAEQGGSVNTTPKTKAPASSPPPIRKEKVRDTGTKGDPRSLDEEPGALTRFGRNVLEKKRATGQLVNEFIQPISTRLDNMAEGLGKTVRAHAYEVGTGQARSHVAVAPFLKQYKKLPRVTKKKLDLAFKNGDAETIAKITDDYHMKDTYKAVRGLLDEIHQKAGKEGFKVGYLKEYMPRKIRDYAGLLNRLYRDKDWGEINIAGRRKAEGMGMDWDAMEQPARAEIFNQVLSDLRSGNPNSPQGNFKQRSIKKLTADLAQYYEDTPTALLQYIDNAAKLMADRRFFNKGSRDVVTDLSMANERMRGNWHSQDVGTHVARLMDEGKLAPENEQQVMNMLQAYFNTGKSNGLVNAYKSVTHITALGSPTSTITQFADLFPSMFRNGMWNTAKGLQDALFNAKKITREDLGIENIAADFADLKGLAKVTNAMFKAIGFSDVDRLGKETFVNASFRKLQKQARAPKGTKTYKKIYNQLKPALKNDTEAAIKAFARGDKNNELVRFALFDQISDFQPITRAEMPEKYLSSPNGRIFYTLKSFTIRQFDALRRESFAEMRKGNVAKGAANLAVLGTYWITLGSGVDAAKDFMLGRDFNIPDLAIENSLKAMGVSRWTIYQGKKEGPVQAAVNTVAPPFQFYTDLWKDLADLTQGEFELKHSETLKSIPIVGKIAYWQWGKGKEKEDKKKRENPGF